MNTFRNTTNDLFSFIEKSPSVFHVIETVKKELEAHNFILLNEKDSWNLIPGKKYAVIRNDSSLIAFCVPQKESLNSLSARIIASHSDSPSFKVKPKKELHCDKTYVSLNVEKYGGMLYASWFDRPLSLAGRVIVKEDGIPVKKLIHFDRDLLLIPNVAIHMNRDINTGYAYNPQIDMLPLFSQRDDNTQAITSLKTLVAKELDSAECDILGSDLYLYNRESSCLWGANSEFASAARLDDLQCVFASLKAFILSTKDFSDSDSSKNGTVPVLCIFDNEEVGSSTKQGALSTFFKDVLERIIFSLGLSSEDYKRMLAKSFMISADNAHAVHPNHPEYADPSNRPYLNGGPVIKYNANQKYTTDAISESIFKMICKKALVPYQSYANRSDIAGGSTLGNLSTSQVSINSVDIGLPQLAMHSPYETTGVRDTEYFVKLASTFWSDLQDWTEIL